MSNVVYNAVGIWMKNGKIRITRINRPVSRRDVMMIGDHEEAFLVGPYPDKNVMITSFDRYHSLLMEVQNNCPNARNWQITAIVFMVMFVLMGCIQIHQSSYAKNLMISFVKKQSQ